MALFGTGRFWAAVAFLTYGFVTLGQSQTLRQGNSGPNVAALQFLLRFNGISGVSATSAFDAGTNDAVKKFQSSAGLTSDGVAGPATLGKLFEGASIEADEEGDHVRAFQTLVCVREKAACERNAKFDAATVQATRTYQQSKKLPVTGQADTATWRALFGIGTNAPPPPLPAPKTPRQRTAAPRLGKALSSHLDFIIKHEKLVPCYYLDPVGLPTICIGHLITPAERQIYKPGTCLSREQCMQLLRKDVERFEKCIDEYINVPLNCNQFGATLSLVFNIGCNNYKSSTTLRQTNARAFASAAEAMKLWNKGGKPLRVLPGLITRRNEEAALFMKSDATRCL